jgi:hypothetical protein
VVQWKTQGFDYWRQNLEITAGDIEYLYNFLIEVAQPVSLERLALALVQGRCRLEEEARKADLERGVLYKPQGKYSVGQDLVFSAFDFALARIVGERPGYNPKHGEFTVIEVQFEDEDEPREFASELQTPHRLNAEAAQALDYAAGLTPPEDLYAEHGSFVGEKVEEALSANEEFVNFGDLWSLRGLLADIHLGHCNIAEAMIDVSGKPLSAIELLKELDLPADLPLEVKLFSLNHALQVDERFNDVGPRGQALWFLRRLEPPEVTLTPRRLQAADFPYDLHLLNADLRRLVAEIDDELSDPALIGSPGELSSVTITLNYPHNRSGSLPLTPRTRHIFPQGDGHHTMITFADGSGNTMPGWVVHEGNYVCGLEGWYRQQKVPVGAYINLQKTSDPLTVEISLARRHMKRDWIRVAKVENKRLTFQIQNRSVACKYDELVSVEDDDPASVDAFWQRAEGGQTPLYELLREIIPELAKLNPQGTVHAKTLYSAVNIARRCPPEAVFSELVSHACFIHVGHGNWTFDPNL